MVEVTQDQITNALTSSMDQFLKEYKKDMGSTLVIEAEIDKIVDKGLGIYNVSYQHNKFEATSANTETTYEVGDIVYIVVPQGNFDKNKIILSPAVSSKASNMVAGMETVYLTIGENLFKSVPDVKLCTYKPHDALPTGTDASPIVNVDITGFNSLFMAALTESRTFNFTCKIRTNIERNRRSGGNYGLILDIPVTQEVNGKPEEKYYSVIMDVNNITGDPYDFQVPALQNLYFTLPEDYKYYNGNKIQPRLRSFVTGFFGEDNTKPDDIFITDIQVLPTLKKASADLKGYFALLTASNGYSFLASRTGDIKTLSVTPYYNGRVTNPLHFSCYWFKENSLIDTSSDKFQRFGGVGWEILNEVSKKNLKEDGTYNYEYITDKYNYTIKQNDLHCDTRFKCVLVKDKDNITITAMATIKNLASPANIKLTTLTDQDVFAAGIGDVRLQVAFTEAGITDVDKPNFTIGYSWQRLDKLGGFIDTDFYKVEQLNKKVKNTYYTIIRFPVSEIDEANTIGCTVYIDTPDSSTNTVKRQTIGTSWLTIGVADYSGGHISLTNGDRLYKYDADGDSPMVADYDGPTSSIIKSTDPITINIFKEDGTELTADEYATVGVEWLVPINSMIELDANTRQEASLDEAGYYKITGDYNSKNTLNYKIATSYSKNKTDNTIIVRVSAPKSVLKQKLVTNTNIRFLKDGESGTNGSKYSAIITYGGYGYGEKYGNEKPYKFQLIYAADKGAWYVYNPATKSVTGFSQAQFGVKLYTDGLSLDSNLSAAWNIFDADYHYNADAKCPINIDSSSGKVTPNGQKWTNPNETFCTTIQVKVRARRTADASSDTSMTNSEEYVYAYYPIECAYVAKYDYITNGNIPVLEGGFDKVLYASDGTNPQYDSSKPFTVSDALGDLSTTVGEEHVNYGYTWSSSINLTNKEIKDANGQVITNQRKVVPATKYDNGVAKNYIRVALQMTQAANNILKTRKDQIITDKNSLTASKNYYTDIQPSLDIFQNFNYNKYVTDLSNANDLFILKTNLSNTCNILLQYINQLLEVSKTYADKDSKVKIIYDEANSRKPSVNNLITYTSGIGVKQANIDNIRSIIPDSLIIAHTLEYENRYYRLSIIDAIERYNVAVKQVYSTDFNTITQNNNIDRYEANVETTINNIKGIFADAKFKKLVNTSGAEQYRYTGLNSTISARLNSMDSLISAKSYSDVINNIIDPIKDEIEYYRTLSYNNTINELNSKITKLNGDLAIVEGLLKPTNSVFVIHAKPIIMVTNRYEMSNLNGWDGNKLKISDNEGYILAPQVGAGKKEEDNSFTGMVMGVKQIAEKATGAAAEAQKIGLLGFYQGSQSLFLNAEDGSAIFGLNNAGQITIDPTGVRNGKKVGLLYSTNFWENFKVDGKPDGYTSVNYSKKKEGMLIDFVTPEIRFGNGNFIVNSDGHITAVGGGSISGWEIGEKDFYSSGVATCAIYSKGTPAQGRMVLDSGAVKSQDADGNIKYSVHHQGKIFTGNHNSVTSTADGFYLSQDGLSLKRSWTENNGTERHFSSLVFDLTQNNKGPELYSNGHSTVDSPRDGFYIGQSGISISSNNNANRFELNMANGNYPKIFSNAHNSVDAKKLGFYLSHDGLSMQNEWYEGKDKIQSSFVLDMRQPESDGSTPNRKGPELYSNGHSTVDNTRDGFYLGQGGLSIGNGDNRFELNVSEGKYPTMYANKHSSLDSTQDGWYIGPDGFSISKSWDVDIQPGVKELRKSSFKINMHTDLAKDYTLGPELISNGHTFGSYLPGFYLGQQGLSISSNSNARIELSTAGEPKIYSGRHTGLNSSNDGFYLGDNGMSIGSKLFFSADGYVRIGNRATTDGNRCWTIDASGADHSYIGYNTNFFGFDFTTKTFADGTGNRQVYIGTDGWRLGTKFAIDNDGNMYLRDGDIECERLIANREGQIGGWNIGSGSLYYVDEHGEGIYINTSGTIETADYDKATETGWRLSKDGTIYARKIYALSTLYCEKLLPYKECRMGSDTNKIKYFRGDDIYGDHIYEKHNGDWLSIGSAIEKAEEALSAAGAAKARADEAYSKAEAAYDHVPAHTHSSGSLKAGDKDVSGSTGGVN